jgi:SAM-dependent methyltransferase
MQGRIARDGLKFMQDYSKGFARIYNQKWGQFARQIAPMIQAYYEADPAGIENRTLLDLCCGTGQLAVHFLKAGYRVVGLDLSENMLNYARENTREYIENGQAEFIQGDAANFKLERRFGLVISSYDALNHLENLSALRNCFACVHAVCDGMFVFDLNTRRGLRRWNNIQVDESDEDAMVITRGVYDGVSDRAWTRLSGFFKTENGLFERFEETVYNTVYNLREVEQALSDTGWTEFHFARAQDLGTALPDPEEEGRVFVVAIR